MSLNTVTDPQGNLIEVWNDSTRTYTNYRTGSAVSRAYTAAENAEADVRVAVETAVTNEKSLMEKAGAAIETNKTFLAITSPTNAQVVAQVKALTRQNNALIRLITKALGDVSGT